MWTLKQTVPNYGIAVFDNDGKQIAEVYDEQIAQQIVALPELFALAERVARLNRDAGEIGPGMLASLVDDARAAIRSDS